jgi:hypothetical protein
LIPLVEVEPFNFSRGAFNWEARKVMMTAQIRFDHMHSLVVEKQQEVEAAGVAALAKLASPAQAPEQCEALVREIGAHVERALDTWRRLSNEMLFRFSDNSALLRMSTKRQDVGQAENTAAFGYPAWWLRSVGYDRGPPPPPRETRCPPACASSTFALSLAAAEEGEAWPPWPATAAGVISSFAAAAVAAAAPFAALALLLALVTAALLSPRAVAATTVAALEEERGERGGVATPYTQL